MVRNSGGLWIYNFTYKSYNIYAVYPLWHETFHIEKKMWYIYTMAYYSAIKERNWVICRDVDGPRQCHIEWSKSEREKQILCINAYMWNLEKWYRWPYLQRRNRDSDVENKSMDTKGDGGSGMNWEIGIDIYTLICIKQITNKNLLYKKIKF